MMRKIMIFCAVVSATANAEAVRQEEAHVHGAAALNIVLEQQQLLIEFESPAYNIVGFEHKPNNEEQEQAAHKAEETLQDAARLFGLPSAAECQLVEADVEWSLEQHDQEGGERISEKQVHSSEATHSEFHAQYAFQCSSPNQANALEVLLFQHFPNLKEIETQIIGPNGQTALELTPDAYSINLGS